MAQSKKRSAWYHERKWSAVIALLALTAAYSMASLAIDSGNLLEYFVTLCLFSLAVNRLAHLVLISLGKTSQKGQKEAK